MKPLLILYAGLLLTACDPAGDGPFEGDCEVDERTCAGDQEFQECIEGEWSEPIRCPPEGEPPLEIRTFCNDGLCTP